MFVLNTVVLFWTQTVEIHHGLAALVLAVYAAITILLGVLHCRPKLNCQKVHAGSKTEAWPNMYRVQLLTVINLQSFDWQAVK